MRIPLGHFDGDEQLAVRQAAVVRLDAYRRFDGIRARLHEHVIQGGDLITPQILHSPVFGDAAEQDSAPSVGERSDFVGQDAALRASEPRSRELHPLELPPAVLASRDLIEELL